MKIFVAVSGDPDTNIEAQSEDDIAEQGKTPAVTEGAVRNTDQGIPHTAPSGAKTSTFRSVVNSVFVMRVSNMRHKILTVQPHVYVHKYEDIAYFVCTYANDFVIRIRRSFLKNLNFWTLNKMGQCFVTFLLCVYSGFVLYIDLRSFWHFSKYYSSCYNLMKVTDSLNSWATVRFTRTLVCGLSHIQRVNPITRCVTCLTKECLKRNTTLCGIYFPQTLVINFL